MTENQFPLDAIFPNPYQVRLSKDTETIKALADNIYMNGLLQTPSARITTVKGAQRIELVFGHTRLDAFKLLEKNKKTNKDGKYSMMPLNIVEMTDQQMFQSAVSENVIRHDLTPIEEAKAIVTARDTFGTPIKVIAELFGVSESVIYGKIRLLELPENIQPLVGKEIAESSVRDIQVFYSLPEAARESTIWIDGQYVTREKALEMIVVRGASYKEIHDLVSGVIRVISKDMERMIWKEGDELHGEGIVGLCTGCEFKLAYDNKTLCLKDSCYDQKDLAFKRQYLQQASLLSGITTLEDDRQEKHTTFSYGEEPVLEKIKKDKCENLRLKYSPSYNERLGKVTHLANIGFEKAEIVCGKSNGHCTCSKAISKGVEVAVKGGKINESALKDARAIMREKARIDKEIVEVICTDGKAAIYESLKKIDAATLKLVLKTVASYSAKLSNAETLDELFSVLAEIVIQKNIYDTGDKDYAFRAVNSILSQCGLPALEMKLSNSQPEENEPGIVRVEDLLDEDEENVEIEDTEDLEEEEE